MRAWSTLVVAVVTLAGVSLSSVDAPAQPSKGDGSELAGLTALDSAMRRVVSRVGPSVLNVIAYYPARVDRNGKRREAKSFSSTGLVFGDGRHVLAPAGAIAPDAMIYLEGAHEDGRPRQFRATLVGRDVALNLAVLRLYVDTRLTAATIGEPKDLAPGAFVMSFSRQYRRPISTRFGLVTGTDHEIETDGRTMRGMISASIAIAEEEVGAAVTDARGRVVGIVLSAERRVDTESSGTADTRDGATALPFTLPIDRALAAARTIVAGDDPAARRDAPRRFLGVRGGYLDKPNALSSQLGLPVGVGFVVDQVFEGEAADRAGVKVHDVILSLAGFPIDGSEYALALAIDKVPAGRPAALRVLRRGERVSLEVRFDAKKKPAKVTPANGGGGAPGAKAKKGG